MTVSVTKSKSQAPLRVVKVTPILSASAGKKSVTNDNSDGSTAKYAASQDKVQIEEMLNKGLDLAETGIGLGINVVVRLGSIFKDQVFDKINSFEMLNSVMGNTSDTQAQAEQGYYPEEAPAPASEQTATPEQANYLINRLPLFSGGDVLLSFSINNDSLTSEKEIQLKIEPFLGGAQQYSIDASAFSVTPSQIVIAPADFEKFVIKGKIPKNAPEDTYSAWITVAEEQTYQIPVVLVVSKPHDAPTEKTVTRATDQQSEPLAEPLIETAVSQVLEE